MPLEALVGDLSRVQSKYARPTGSISGCDCYARVANDATDFTLCTTCEQYAMILQVWLSPWQVSHVLSIVSFVESTLHRVIGPEPGVPPATPISMAATPADQAVPTGLAASAMKTQLRLTLSAEIPLISVLCLVWECFACVGVHTASLSASLPEIIEVMIRSLINW